MRIRDKGETIEDPEVDKEGAEHDTSDSETGSGSEKIRDKGETDRNPIAGDGAEIPPRAPGTRPHERAKKSLLRHTRTSRTYGWAVKSFYSTLSLIRAGEAK